MALQKAALLLLRDFQKGDIVVQLGDSVVVDMMSYMRALSSFDEGNSTKVTVDRKGEQVEAEITF